MREEKKKKKKKKKNSETKIRPFEKNKKSTTNA
jgi:hypothetical protein